jgi:hypothetical protein
LSIAISCSTEKVLVLDETYEWWQPILQKHNLELGAYNNLGNVFEMGKEGNSINNGVCTLKVATVLIKSKNTYLLIEADTVYHNFKEGVLDIKSGIGKVYKMDAIEPSSTLMGISYIKVGRQDLLDIKADYLFSKK